MGLNYTFGHNIPDKECPYCKRKMMTEIFHKPTLKEKYPGKESREYVSYDYRCGYCRLWYVEYPCLPIDYKLKLLYPSVEYAIANTLSSISTYALPEGKERIKLVEWWINEFGCDKDKLNRYISESGYSFKWDRLKLFAEQSQSNKCVEIAEIHLSKE